MNRHGRKSTRPLETTQRAVRAVDLVPHLAVEAAERQRAGVECQGEKGKATTLAAEAEGVSMGSVEKALRIQRRAPELFQRMRVGNLTLSEAYRQMREDM